MRRNHDRALLRRRRRQDRGDCCLAGRVFGCREPVLRWARESFSPEYVPAGLDACRCNLSYINLRAYHFGCHLRSCFLPAGLCPREVPLECRRRWSRASTSLRQRSGRARLDGLPILIVLVLFLATARVIHSVEDARKPPEAVEVIAIGHQFWWEFRYPSLGVVTANELHVPVSDPAHPTPTFIRLLSADTDHSFWVPRLAGKSDLIPNRTNNMWIDPHEAGIYVGQCAQYCGTQHAKMLLRVYVEPQDQFKRWVQEESKPAQVSDAVSEGRRIFETTACINCHAISGTVADGRFGYDLPHLMSRETIASGAASNTPENLRLWIHDPEAIKPGSLMPAMKLTDQDLDALTAYLETLQ